MSSAELRAKIIEVTLKNGGHLASSLGAVEIALALRKVFDPEKDRILWDVGHQAYAWKLLTGREDRFDTLRQTDGIAPFPLPSESAADAAVAGHAGSALSVAVGMAAGGFKNVVAVVGDSSISCGHSFEAMNNAAGARGKVIVVLNDNRMSISGPVGALSKYFGRLLANRGYNRVKSAAEDLGHKAGFTFLREIYHKIESRMKGLFVGSRFFEQFGFRYIGPVDGHDLKALEDAFTVAKNDKRSVVVHVATVKGKGYEPAEKDPTKYHGVTGRGTRPACPDSPGWSEVFGAALCELAREDPRLVAITAGMTEGTGLAGFAAEFPDRFYDVGIAEGHAVGFAAGLAAAGKRPVVAIYSTFLQRAVDQIVHDVAIAKLPVIFAIDRAGVVGADGITHHGLLDVAFLSAVPDLVIAEPKDAEDLKALLKEAVERGGSTAIRYPRGNRSNFDKVKAVAEALGCECAHARYLKPLDTELLKRKKSEGKKIVFIGDFSSSAATSLFSTPFDRSFTWPDEFISHGGVADLEKRYGLDVPSIISSLSSLTSQTSPILLYG